MKLFFNVVLIFLIFLAASSGITKVILMQHDVAFFGQFGFTNLTLIWFGVVQLLGGLLLAIPKTRVVGAAIVAMTFFMSAAILVMAGNVIMAIVTLVCILLLGVVIKKSFSDVP